MDDSKIIALFNERSQLGLTELSQKYGKLCLKIAENILKNREDSEECVNDAYLAVWNTVPPENPDPLKTYLLKIVRNTAIKKYHSNTAVKRNSFYDTALEELENILFHKDTVETELLLKELSEAVNSFLRDTSKENRVIFLRRYYFGDSVKDIAEITGNTPHFVSVRLSRTREKLKKYLQKEGLL
ncbi:MAG: sigma-70 family RNA polymerase sigma factor [Clostridia bacterium]|nr:sigma-70 family RNA polymerase sigma factor [Clostridia bacterium]